MSDARHRWVIGNWKMNGSLAGNAALMEAIAARRIATGKLGVCVPSPYLNQGQKLLSGTAIALGAQDLSAHDSGAFTGQVSASMLREFGVSLVLVGHSERRQFNAETSEEVAAKARAAFVAGLTPVICVGETLVERDAGLAEATVAAQIEPCAALIRDAGLKLVFAYEPVWAIGTGKTATPAQAEEMHAFMREEIARYSPDARSVSILYGGSVKPGNAKELFAQPNIDGGLIGGASLVAADFLAIAEAL